MPNIIVAVDAARRMALPGALVYVIGTVILWPIVAPLWFARRPLRAGERRKGGTFWHWTKGFVAIWTVGMIVLSVASLTATASTVDAQTTAEGVGSAIGLGLGGGILCGIWLVPAVLLLFLGLLLRNDNVQEGPTDSLAVAASLIKDAAE